MRMFSSVIIKLCIVLAAVELSLGAKASKQKQVSAQSANPVAAAIEFKALEQVKPIDVANKDALEFTVETMGPFGKDYEEKLIVGISHWFALREDVDANKFKQAYSRHVKEKCKQLKSTPAVQLSAQDKNKLQQKLAACEILLRKKVECKVKAVVKDCGCKNNLKYRKSSLALTLLLWCAGLLACAIGITYGPSPNCCSKKNGSNSDDGDDDHDH